MSKPHPAKRSRLAVLLVSIFSFIYTVSAMSANGIKVKSSQISTPNPSISPNATPTPTLSVKISKISTKKTKIHTVSGATKKK